MSSDLPSALFTSPAIVGGGVGGIVAILLIVVLRSMLVRIDDTIHEFMRGQEEIVKEIASVGNKVAESVTVAMVRIHEDNVTGARETGIILGKLDVLLERTSMILQNVNINRGVVEPHITGRAPAIMAPSVERNDP